MIRGGGKRILIVHRYYWPDKTPCSSIIYGISNYLASNGHEVDVLTSKPSYRVDSQKERSNLYQQRELARIYRINLPFEANQPFLRIANSINLGFKTILRAISSKYDVIISTSTPPILGPLFGAIAASIRRSRFIYYCMDINPEVGLISGDFSNRLLYKFLESIDIWSTSRAETLLVLSTDMMNTFLRRPYTKKLNIQILNNFSVKKRDLDETKELFDLNISNKSLTILYAGNIGRFQGLEKVVEVFSSINHVRDIELIILGEGVEKNKLISLSRGLNANIRFLPYQSETIAKALIKQSDIALLTLKKDVYKYAYPSKTMSYLEQGKPIIAIIEKESELAQDILKNNCGYIIDTNRINQLPDLLIKLKNDKSWKKDKEVASLNLFRSRFSPEFALNEWLKIIEKYN